MISLQSLSEQLLPNIYVKKLSLETNYKTVATVPTKQGAAGLVQGKNSTTVAPSDTMSCKISLSIKFPYNKGTGFESDLLTLLDSEFAQKYYVHVHQITNKKVFDEFVAYNSDGSYTDVTKNRLRSFPTYAPHIESKRLSIIEVFKNSQYLNKQPVTSGVKKLPIQTLDDGTLLSEMVADLTFDGDPLNPGYQKKLSKQTNFLGYIFVSSINTDELSTDPILSGVSKQIVILNGQFQDKGLIFTIAPFSPNNPNANKLLAFGNPGDIWAGPVHYHTPTQAFMVGATHSSEPHPVLDYSIVKNTKFIDNRVVEKVEKVLYNATKNFNALNSLGTVYRSNKNALDFPENKQIPYVSDIVLTQDSMGNVEGYFAVDKPNILLDKCYFKSYLDNVRKLSSQIPDLSFLNMLTLSKLIKCSVINNNQIVASVDEDSINTPQVFDFINGKTTPTQTVSFTLERASLYGDASLEATETFLFKHKIGNQDINSGPTISTQRYSVEAEYSDPTIDFVKYLRNSINNALISVQALLEYVNTGKLAGVNPDKGFDTITGKINPKIIKAIKVLPGDQEPALSTSEVNFGGTVTQTALLLNSIRFLPYSYIYAFFYSPALEATLSVSDFINYFFNSSNIKTATLDSLLQLQLMLEHMVNTFDSALKPVNALPPKVTKGSGYVDKLSDGNVKKISKQRSIQVKSKNEFMITTHDHGYDFTGFIDNNSFKKSSTSGGFGNLFFNGNFYPTADGRNKESFLKILLNDYELACIYNFSEISKEANVAANPSLNFQPPTTKLELSVPEIAFSFLSTPALNPSFLASSVVLPSTVYVSDNNSPQIIFTSIVKLNKQILENNRLFINQALNQIPAQGVAIALAEDLLSLHAKQGVTFPSIPQGQFVKIGTQIISDSDPDTDIPESDTPDQDDDAPEFLIKYKFEATETGKNNLMNSLLNKQLLNTNSKQYSFDYKGFLQGLDGKYSNPQRLAIQTGRESLQTLCLATKSPSGGPFKDYMNSDQGYIKNGIIDPARLSQFFFLHQNVVKVEYLSGYQSTSYDLIVPDEDPYTGKTTSFTKRNINKPVWKIMTREILDSLSNAGPEFTGQILCRVVRYDSPFINKHLVRKLEMPFINSHFILQR